MTGRRSRDYGDPERGVCRHDVSDLPMFQPTSTELGLAARDDTAAKHARDIERLIPLARELAAKAGPSGVTVSDLRIVAVQRSLLTGSETGRSLAWLGKVMEAADLVNTGQTRRSAIPKSHGNRHSVFVSAEFSHAHQRSVSRNDVQDKSA